MSKMFPKLSIGINFNFGKKNYFDVPSPVVPSQNLHNFQNMRPDDKK